ncbi:hypothetical protein KYG_20435 [Acidovorax sp. NO-1]|uniref:hypothetical protein n=1 Tax=Acidovorax sp. NO-1 TaxID=512030 RepID=UPI00023FC886|nr:hypothetical protein [Acidovorax sp. NO-1]EHL20896.1 hypothetical protein KYG_20435 [Acidovorax sp. NO-1]
MKRIVISVATALVLGTVGLYYGAPSLFKEPLLSANRHLSGLEEKTADAAMHTIHYLDNGTPQTPRRATAVARPSFCCTAFLRRKIIGWILRDRSPASTG